MKLTRSSYVLLALLVLALLTIIFLLKNQNVYKSALNDVMYKNYMTLVSTSNNTSLAFEDVTSLNDITYEKAKILVSGYEIIHQTFIQMNDVSENLNLVPDNSLLKNANRNVAILTLFSDYITYGPSNIKIDDKDFQEMVKYNNDLTQVIKSYNSPDRALNINDWIPLLKEVSDL
jgi:hypothetical protein